MDCQQPGSWPELRCRDLKRNRSATVIIMLSRDFQVGDGMMVYMPYQRTGKNRKLSRPYFGPYRVMEVHPNAVTVWPVDCPKEKCIRVNLNRVTLCPVELPNVSWLGQKRKSKRASKNWTLSVFFVLFFVILVYAELMVTSSVILQILYEVIILFVICAKWSARPSFCLGGGYCNYVM